MYKKNKIGESIQIVSNMTIKEIHDLKQEYKHDFIIMVRKFFEDRPLLQRVQLENYNPAYNESIEVRNIKLFGDSSDL